MLHSPTRYWFTLLLGLALSPAVNADTPANAVKPFPDNTLSSWREKSFAGNTNYELVEDDGSTVLKATANETASVLYKEKIVDLNNTPWLAWSWKIDSIYRDIDERTRDGDDFPARMYVTAQVGLLPWNTIAINYVWSSNEPLGAYWPNPFTDKSIMVSVQSGPMKAGQWVEQRRNIVADFVEFFNVDVEQISGYAVMVDGDNAQQLGTAYFGNIDFLKN